MVLSADSSTAGPFIVVLDAANASLRALLFDSGAHQMEGYGARLPVTAEPQPTELALLQIDCLDELHRQVQEAGFRVGAVAGCEESGIGDADRPPWPAFDGAAWFPALPELACASLGSGSVTPDRFSLIVGASSTMGVVMEAASAEAVPDLDTIRVDDRRQVLYGSAPDADAWIAWARRTLALPRDIEARLDAATPGGHGLTLLPFAGDGRGAISGLTPATTPADILHAALESLALQLRGIYGILSERLAPPTEVVASGSALLKSPALTQMMADALGRPVVVCTEPEPAARGAALWALEKIGAIENLSELPASSGAVFSPRAKYAKLSG